MSIESRGDNKWRFRVRKDGVNYSMNFYGSVKEAEQEHKKFEVDIMRGQIGYNENMKFSELAQLVMDTYVKPFSSENTNAIYYYCYNNHLLKHFGDIKISKITQLSVQKFINDLRKEIGYSTVKIVLSTFKTTFNRAIELKIINYNPCNNVKIPDKPEKRSYTELMSIDEINQLINIIENMKNKAFRAILALAIGMGYRQGEILGIALPDIDFETNIIDINKQFLRCQKQDSKNGNKISKLKTENSYRKTYMPEFVSVILKEYVDSIKIIDIKNQLIFINPRTGKPYSHKSLYNRFSKLLEKNGLRHISFHDLRHLHATILVNNNVNIVAVAKRLGDTIETVSSTYLHSIDKVDKDTAEQLDNFINKAIAK